MVLICDVNEEVGDCMQKHAYMIIAHNEFDLLEILVRLLDDPRNDIYVHIDAKVKVSILSPFRR